MGIREFNLNDEIMASDFYIAIHSEKASETSLNKEMTLPMLKHGVSQLILSVRKLAYIHGLKPDGLTLRSIKNIVSELKDFESKYSRFINNNYLARFNKSKEFKATDEFYEILKLCKKYFDLTDGLFDPAIHKTLISEGYNVSKLKGFYDKNIADSNGVGGKVDNYSFADVELLPDNLVKKPKALTVDLGGIGKSYIVQKVSKKLKKNYANFCINAGGDLYTSGKDLKHGYNFWAVDLEIPTENTVKPVVLILTDVGVATSGTYKRKWEKNGKIKNHIIDPDTKKSVDSDVVSASVIHQDIVYADVLAKTLLVRGSEKGYNYSVSNSIAAIFIRDGGGLMVSPEAQKYVWKN